MSENPPHTETGSKLTFSARKYFWTVNISADWSDLCIRPTENDTAIITVIFHNCGSSRTQKSVLPEK